MAGCRISRSSSPSGRGHLDGQVALGDRRAARPAVAVHAHRAQVRQRRVDPGLDQRDQQVVGGPDVVVDRVALGRGDRIEYGAARCSAKCTIASGCSLQQHGDQPVVLGGDVEVDEADLAPGDLLPGPQPLTDRPDRSQRLHLEVDVDLPAAEVVQDGDVMAAVRQVQRRRPAAEPVAAENQNAHSDSHRISSESCAVTLPLSEESQPRKPVPPAAGDPYGACFCQGA